MLEKSKQIAINWKAIPPKDKEPYQKLAEEDKKRYEKEMKNYIPPEKGSSEDSDEPKKKRKKREKDPDAPKRGMNAYMHFVNDRRPELKLKKPDLKPTEVTTLLGADWAKMSEEDKKPFTKKADADKKRYLQELEKYKAKK